MIVRISACFLLAALAATPAWVQDEADRAPPPDARLLSEIVCLVEKRAGFRSFDEIDWDEDGVHVDRYYMDDRAKGETRVDPITGGPG